MNKMTQQQKLETKKFLIKLPQEFNDKYSHTNFVFEPLFYFKGEDLSNQELLTDFQNALKLSTVNMIDKEYRLHSSGSTLKELEDYFTSVCNLSFSLFTSTVINQEKNIYYLVTKDKNAYKTALTNASNFKGRLVKYNPKFVQRDSSPTHEAIKQNTFTTKTKKYNEKKVYVKKNTTLTK
jgi:hypothetical protein